MRIRQEQKAEIRAALLRAGLDLITSQGFEATTVDEITSAAGVGKATFYNYFATKEELALAIYGAMEAENVPHVETIFTTYSGVRERLDALFELAMKWTMTYPAITWVWCMEPLKRLTDVATEPRHPRLFGRYLCQALAEGIAAGEIRADRPAETLAMELEGILLVHIAVWLREGAGPELPARVRAAVAAHLDGIALSQKGDLCHGR